MDISVIEDMILEAAKEREFDHLSFSSLRKYIECPFNFAKEYLLGLKPKPTPQMLKGSQVHHILEKFFKGELIDIAGYEKQVGMASNLVQMLGGPEYDLHPEMKINVSLDMLFDLPTDAEFLGFIDLVIESDRTYLIDFKTGRPYSHHEDQLMLYKRAYSLLTGIPESDITTLNLYLRTGDWIETASSEEIITPYYLAASQILFGPPEQFLIDKCGCKNKIDEWSEMLQITLTNK